MVNYVNRENDETIINIVRDIFSFGVWDIETINEAVLFKLMQLRGTPIKCDKVLRNIEQDYKWWCEDTFEKLNTPKQENLK